MDNACIDRMGQLDFLHRQVSLESGSACSHSRAFLEACQVAWRLTCGGQFRRHVGPWDVAWPAHWQAAPISRSCPSGGEAFRIFLSVDFWPDLRFNPWIPCSFFCSKDARSTPEGRGCCLFRFIGYRMGGSYRPRCSLAERCPPVLSDWIALGRSPNPVLLIKR
jgi:hypothetical protein